METTAPRHGEEETVDGPYGLKIVQRKRGYRYSQDSLILAEFAATDRKMVVCDLGTGSGVIPLILAKRGLAKRIVGIEIQPRLAEIARRNVAINGYEGIIEIVELDLRRVSERLPCRSFDYVLSNPPYREPSAGKIAPDEEKAIAKHEMLCTMGDVLDAMRYLLKPLRRGACIYPAARTPELMVEARKRRLEPKRIQFVYPPSALPQHGGKGRGAELVVVEFLKEGKPGAEVLPPLFTFKEKGG
ncbi:MAG: methyltransferase [Candidatus Methanosuratincola sp.]|jgi:tRNA1Val (adenine37-N6)-methyltransferase